MAFRNFGKWRSPPRRSEHGGFEPGIIIGIIVAFAILYYSSIWLLQFMRDTKYERKKARGLANEVYVDENTQYPGASY